MDCGGEEAAGEEAVTPCPACTSPLCPRLRCARCGAWWGVRAAAAVRGAFTLPADACVYREPWTGTGEAVWTPAGAERWALGGQREGAE